VIIVFDTGVWVSALEYGGVPQKAISHAFSEEQLAISD
jgi:predicted nucleic acid-binding protein